MNENSEHRIPPEGDGSSYWPRLFQVVFVASLIFFTNLGSAQLWDRDEPRNAGCAVEMLDRGDWVVPIFNGELRGQKPALLYWLMMSAYQLWGTSAFSARFWSALLAVGTVVTTFSMGHRLWGPKVAWLSAIILASNIMFPLASRAATPDALLIFLSTLTIAFYVWGSTKRFAQMQSERLATSLRVLNWRWLLAMGISMGLALLAKGPIGFLMPMAIMGMHFLIIGRNRHPQQNAVMSVVHPIHLFKTALSMRPLLLLMIALLVALPWYVMVSLKTEGEFLNIFFLKEHLGRSTTMFEHHGGGFWFYPLAILFGFFPWSLFWLPVAIILYRRQAIGLRDRSAVSLMLCWVGVQVGIFSLLQTKLPSYVTPCYPALSILTAVGLETWIQQRVNLSDRWIKAAMMTGVVSGLVIASGMAIAAYHYAPKLTWLPLSGIFGVVIAVSFAIGYWQLRGEKNREAIFSCVLGAVCFSWLLFGWGTVGLSELQNNRRILDHIAEMPPDVAVASYECLEPSWPFYSRRTIYETFGDAEARPAIQTHAETKAGTNAKTKTKAKAKTNSKTKAWQLKPVTTPEAFAQQNKTCVFITTDDLAADLIQRLPEGFEVRRTADYFLTDKTLVLIGR